MNIKTKWLLLASIIVLFALFISGYVLGHKSGKESLKPTVEAQGKEIARYQVTLDGLKVYVSKQEQEITTLHEALKNSELSREEMRKLHLKSLQEVTRLKLTIDTLIKGIHVGDSVVYVENPIGNCVLLPFTFSKHDAWLDLNGIFKSQDSLMIGLKMRINADIFTDYNRKTNSYNVTVTSDNPYLRTKELKSMKFDAVVEKKWGIGLFAGYGLTINGKPQFTPMVGVGVSRNLFRF